MTDEQKMRHRAYWDMLKIFGGIDSMLQELRQLESRDGIGDPDQIYRLLAANLSDNDKNDACKEIKDAIKKLERILKILGK